MDRIDTRHRRHAAGTDPAKRAAILDGAAQVFLEKGFDGAGVNDICRAAGVSKSTLYVYFDTKETLFGTLVEYERDRLFAGVERQLEGDAPLEVRLTGFATRVAEMLCSDPVIRAQRAMIGMAERMPELGAQFYEGGAQRSQRLLAQTLDREVATGRLVILDTGLAAYQLVELATAGLWRQRLFGRMTEPPERGAIEATAQAAVAMFLSRYSA
ncbi:TetR/AcrR family transcriptional regulator [Palleronia sp.]|uniref:TetR/AcrR family transcriptional regulator n=1 Tax=Palleronia sp. TaxID=1940284 RepID=UPI0035C83DB4